MAVIEERKHEPDRNRFDPAFLVNLKGGAHFVFVHRHFDLAGWRAHTLCHRDAVAAFGQWMNLPRHIKMQGEVVGAFVTPDVQNITETLGGQETNFGTVGFNRDVGGNGCAVTDDLDLFLVNLGDVTNLVNTINNRNQIATAVRAAEIAAKGKTGSLRVGDMSFAAMEIMPRIVREFTSRYPDIELELQYLHSQGQKIELSRNNLDVGFMLGPLGHPQFDVRTLVSEPPVAILSADHRLATRHSLTLSEIAAYPMVLGTTAEWDTYRLFVDDMFFREGHERITTLLAWNRAFKTPALMNFVEVAEELFPGIN